MKLDICGLFALYRQVFNDPNIRKLRELFGKAKVIAFCGTSVPNVKVLVAIHVIPPISHMDIFV